MEDQDLQKEKLDNAVAVANETEAFAPEQVRTEGAITSADLRDEPDIEITQPSPEIEAVGLEAEIASGLESEEKRLQREAEQARRDKAESLEELTRFLTDTPGETERTVRAEEQAGVPQIQKELDAINDQLRREQHRLRRQIEEIQSGAGTATIAQRNVAVSEARRKSLSTQADLAIIQQSIQGRFDSARAIADRAVAVQLERDRNELQALTLTYQDNKELFDKAEQRAFETAQKERERKLEKEEQRLTQLNTLSLQALQNGAPIATVIAMRNAETVEEAISLSGDSLVDKMSQLELLLKREQLSAFREDRINARKEAALRQEALEKAANSGIVTLTKEQKSDAFKLIDDFEKESENFKNIANSYTKIQASAKNPSAAGDVSLIFAYMKMLDPTSVVREGEQATARNTGSIPQRVYAQYNKALNGESFTEEQREDFVSRAGIIYKTELKKQKEINNQFTIRSQQFNVPPETVVRDLTLGIEEPLDVMSNDELIDVVDKKNINQSQDNTSFYQLFKLNN